MNATSAHFAEVYQRGTEMIVVVEATDWTVRVLNVINGVAAPISEAVECPAGYLASWRLVQRLPRLTCISSEAAHQAAALLAEKGVSNVFTSNYVVAASMSASSVMKFADDAMENGWAHDEDCARMIGDLG